MREETTWRRCQTADPVRYRHLTTAELRESFLLDKLFTDGALNLVHTDADRAIVGGATPTDRPLALSSSKELAAEFFCERREAGVINIGAKGTITVDDAVYAMDNRDCLYIGRGGRSVEFAADDSRDPARFYILSYPAAREYPTTHAGKGAAERVDLGAQETSNRRTIYKYIHPAGIGSSQLVLGFTELAPGSVWNTMPPHTHTRRTEVYLYFDLPADQVVLHLMGRPEETRHLVVRDRQAVVSPSWSLHSGCGTSSYAFVWGMGGENQTFDDMDGVPIADLR